MASSRNSPADNSMRPITELVDRCWTVPVVAACSTLVLSMPETNSGLFYVLFMEKFGVNREAASWPKSINSAAKHFMGFVIAAAQEKVSIYTFILLGALLAPAAVVASSFVPSMQWMTLTFGFFYGVALGTLLIATSIYIVSYFDEYRGVATGIKFLGVSLSGVVGPSLLTLLADTYGLQGTLLLAGGITLHLIPLTLLLKNPRPVRVFCGVSCKLVNNSKDTTITSSRESPEANESHSPCEHNRLTKGLHGCDNKYGNVVIPASRADHVDTKKNTIEMKSDGPVLFESATPVEEPRQERSTFFSRHLSVLSKPVFYVLLFPMIAADFTLPLLASTIVDYAGDKGVPLNSAAQLVTCLCLGGFCGRLVIPLLSDKVSGGRCPIAALSFALLAVCFIVMPHAILFAAVAAVTFIAGIQQGYLATLKPVLVADYLGVQRVAMSWGLMGVAALPLTFCEPAIVGVFRDTGGSYDNLYRLCGGVNLFACLLLSVQACWDTKSKTTAAEENT
ncbi:monocarboxylate transporter 9-like isoform X2 [Haemaphysalis longicornis]